MVVAASVHRTSMSQAGMEFDQRELQSRTQIEKMEKESVVAENDNRGTMPSLDRCSHSHSPLCVCACACESACVRECVCEDVCVCVFRKEKKSKCSSRGGDVGMRFGDQKATLCHTVTHTHTHTHKPFLCYNTLTHTLWNMHLETKLASPLSLPLSLALSIPPTPSPH